MVIFLFFEGNFWKFCCCRSLWQNIIIVYSIYLFLFNSFWWFILAIEILRFFCFVLFFAWVTICDGVGQLMLWSQVTPLYMLLPPLFFCMFAIDTRSSYVVLAVVEVRALPASASSFEVREQTNKRERMPLLDKCQGLRRMKKLSNQ